LNCLTGPIGPEEEDFAMIETEAALRRSFPAITVAVTSLGFALVQLDGSILNVALSEIGISLKSGISDL
jgi:hypothetical protein